MKHATGHGFVLSLLLNMLFRAGWLALAAILLILHLVIGWPLWLIVIPLVCWVLHALLITLILGWANGSAQEPVPEQKNVNPYSNKNTDFMKR